MKPDAENVTIFQMKVPKSCNYISLFFKTRLFMLGLLLCGVSTDIFSQIPTKTWRTHFNYTDARGAALAGNQVYCFTVNGFFAYDLSAKAYKKPGKELGLHGGVISTLEYAPVPRKLIIGYQDGGIDLAETDEKGLITRVKYVDDFKTSEIIQGGRSFGAVVVNESQAYLSTGQVILLVDLHDDYIREVIRNFGPNGSSPGIAGLKSTADSLFVKTSSGNILASSLGASSNILFYGNWFSSSRKSLFENQVVLPAGVNPAYVNQVRRDANGKYWISDGVRGLLSDVSGAFLSYVPEGLPVSDGLLTRINDKVVFQSSSDFFFEDNSWKAYSGGGVSAVQKDTYGNEWYISGRFLVVSKGGASYTYSISNGLPGNAVSLVIDQNQQVWIGTDNGVSVVQSSNVAVTNPRVPFNPVFGNQRLLIREVVPAIVSDQGNRKWIGTEKGLYLFNESGEEQIDYFNELNSPMPDGKIRNLAVHPLSGEVFVQTGSGVVSYQSDASGSRDDLSDILVYPNPVKTDFQGVLTIDRLENETEVRITDLGGNLVYSTTSNGGKATWDLTKNGVRAPLGIYLVFCRSSTGTKTAKFVIRP
ncbi:T9SS type A sorting domain-containing protein [Emticicia sp. CRIBPO]|uniref:PorZ beta-propeller-like domain-containing protein n=1 Tax=Emticicia sp. CRIBPO TaxID=2683258 RepID=UPI0014123FD1|nr:T9SS type A sorting domain-containing protein [Emticicia sp. CRIBPO]NBA87988.1 T9SS type A sorting domain-containing protein [Emticicia sp. CRIBPO]